MTADDVLRELQVLGQSDIRHYQFDAKEGVKLAEGAPESAMRAVSSVKSRRRTDETGAAIESLEEFVTIDPRPDAPEVQISRRTDGWEPVEIVRGMAAEFTLHSVGLTLKVADLFVV